MRPTLSKWMNDADALYHIQHFGLTETPTMPYAYLRAREDDYYISLVGELFDRLRNPYENPADWSRLGNAIASAAAGGGGARTIRGVLPAEAALFAATAFYQGGFPASAYLVLRASGSDQSSDIERACRELLSRTHAAQSRLVRTLVDAIWRGDLGAIRKLSEHVSTRESASLATGPDDWVGWRLFREMLSKFCATNIRSVLPEGEDKFWDPLVHSFLKRTPPVWDFFPSQIEALRSGLLENLSTYSIQMPTGAGKTALSETLLYHHLAANPGTAAVLLVPYRSLASELRGSLVRHLTSMGFAARCAYGGTVPSGDEVRNLDDTRVLVATPEALSGLLSANSDFFSRISLVVCDEGHLLDSGARGVGLELLLARLRSRDGGPPKFVFVSAIVPNIEEINAWLGGTEETVVRSSYRPALAEFAVLCPVGANAQTVLDMQFHPHDGDSTFTVDRFLSRDDFRYRNVQSGRLNTYTFSTLKTQAIATARKALSMGGVAVFATNKRGNQGAVGLAEELLSQLGHRLSLPKPSQFVKDQARLSAAVEYFQMEYGPDWIGTRSLEAGVVLHHGDIPQESREVVEEILRDGCLGMAICTSTLAEGVNFPIRTLVLYSVQRSSPDGSRTDLLTRDIKNLVGRAGRAGATTKGLVICANPSQWPLVEPVARQQSGENVKGALIDLMGELRTALGQHGVTLSNEILENVTALHTLTDGIDAVLLDLAAEELGEDDLIRIAGELSSQTFAARQADVETASLMKEAFRLRARRIAGIRSAGRLDWIRETGTSARLLESVERDLFPMRDRWDDIESPMDPGLVGPLLAWAWDRPDMKKAVEEAFRDEQPTKEGFQPMLMGWLEGLPVVEIARNTGLDIDVMLGVHSKVLGHSLHVAVEHGVGLLKKILEAESRELSQAAIDFPDHLKFGVPNDAARLLAAGGVRHRRAAVEIGRRIELVKRSNEEREFLFAVARELIEDREHWLPHLGRLVYQRTLEDLAGAP